MTTNLFMCLYSMRPQELRSCRILNVREGNIRQMAVFKCKYPEMCPLRLNCFTTTEWIVCCCCCWLGQRTSWSKVKTLMVDIVCPEMYSNKFFVALKASSESVKMWMHQWCLEFVPCRWDRNAAGVFVTHCPKHLDIV